MVAQTGSSDWRNRKIQEWLLLLLRFAVTRASSDRSAVLAMADELDALGPRWNAAAPSFFLRTSDEVCNAILETHDWTNSAILQKHAARIDDPRLRRAFCAAVGLQKTSKPRQPSTRAKRREPRALWKGLPSR
jgi:hypothetical protein